MEIHELKTWPRYFDLVFRGLKTFEIRKNDRNFNVGDRLDLMEYNPVTKNYTGKHCHRYILSIVYGGQFGIEDGYIIMSLSREPITED